MKRRTLGNEIVILYLKVSHVENGLDPIQVV